MTVRIQGLKARTDMDVMGRPVVTISDVAGKQLLMLDQTAKTVRRMPIPSVAELPKMDVSVERTGQTEQIAGRSCEEFRIVSIMDMSQLGAMVPPEARDAMKDVRMVTKGSSWISTSSPGASEFIKFREAAKASGMTLGTNLFGGQNAPAPAAPAADGAEGLPCLSETEMSYDGTGPMIEMLKKMGTIKTTSRLTEVSLAPIDPAMFVVPADYTEAR
jgi:hypothetical protein